jgi:DNA-binding NtrC family response regulator
MVARAIHDLGPRRDKPFEVVDCGSLLPTLVASELYGHERGAFTGAERRHLGAFERAHGGTLFLDEIGELPLDVQPTLLGVLERGRLRRLGGDHEVAVDVRVVSATHRDLRAATNQGSFRADLYFRLAVARIVVPPLRDRPHDIEPLVRHFVQEATGAGSMLPVDAATMDALLHHRWSGNVRELRNAVASLLALGHMSLDEGSLPANMDAALESTLKPYAQARAEMLSRFERRYLHDLMDRARGNASEAARQARMDRSYLLSLLRRHGLR